jgi:hypothetical protein
MPNHEEHCQHSLERYGERADEIHSWIDEPSRNWGQGHRQFRHDTEAVKLAGKIFGKKYGRELAQNIVLDHIMLDHEEDIKSENSEAITTENSENGVTIPKSTDFDSTGKISIMFRKNKSEENEVFLPDSLPPIHTSPYDTSRTIIDDIYSDFSDKEKVINDLRLLGYEACSIYELRNDYFKTDLEIKRLLYESRQITLEQIKDILRYAGHEQLIDTTRLIPYKFPTSVFLLFLVPNLVFFFLAFTSNFWGYLVLFVVSIFLTYLIARKVEPILHKNTIKVNGKRFQKEPQDIPQWMRKKN